MTHSTPRDLPDQAAVQPGATGQDRRFDRSLALHLRDRLARTAIELTSHELPGALDAVHALVEVEEMLERRYPRVFRARCPQWVRRDASIIHAKGEFNPRCTLCPS